MVAATPYKEWLPPNIEQRHQVIGDGMRDAILLSTGYSLASATGPTPDATAVEAHRRSLYTTVQSIRLFGGAVGSFDFSTGISRDFAFSQQIGTTGGTPITAKALDPVISFTFECGRDEDGGFHPDKANQYPKVEREVAAGLASLLKVAASPAPPPPSPTPTPGPASSDCFLQRAIYSPEAAPVMFLRALRDQQVKATEFGARLMRRIDRAYRAASPAITRFLNRHTTLRTATRVLIANPAIGSIRMASWLASRIGPMELRVRCLFGVIAVQAILATASLIVSLGAGCYWAARWLIAL